MSYHNEFMERMAQEQNRLYRQQIEEEKKQALSNRKKTIDNLRDQILNGGRTLTNINTDSAIKGKNILNKFSLLDNQNILG